IAALDESGVRERCQETGHLYFDPDLAGQLETQRSHADLEIGSYRGRLAPVTTHVQRQVTGAAHEIKVAAPGVSQLLRPELRRAYLELQRLAVTPRRSGKQHL